MKAIFLSRWRMIKRLYPMRLLREAGTLIIAVTAAVLAHFGGAAALVERTAGEQPPSVERTVLQTGRAAVAGPAAHQECPEEARLQSA